MRANSLSFWAILIVILSAAKNPRVADRVLRFAQNDRLSPTTGLTR